jgi:hypothetical protein
MLRARSVLAFVASGGGPRLVLCAAALLVGCTCGDDRPGAAAVDGDAGELPLLPGDELDAAPPMPTDPARAIQQLGAIAAWEAVVSRDQYLARRGQRGVVYGTVGAEIFDTATAEVEPPPLPPAEPVEAVANLAAGGIDAASLPPPVPPPRVAETTARRATGLHWLIDDTEGGGALGIRVAFPAGKAPAAGSRVAIGGAWSLDERQRWYWKADAVSPIPAAAAPIVAPGAAPPTPSHAIPVIPLPAGYKPVSAAVDNGIVVFQIVTPPREEGEGWKVQDRLGTPIAATLIFPGERPSYGGRDLRSPDERWQLKRKFTYWVRIGKVRRKDPLAPATINAVGPPARAW